MLIGKEVNRMNKKIVFPVAALLILGAGIIGVNSVSAQDTEDTSSTLVQKIAAKFSLNEDDVQKVFDEARNEHHAEMQKNQTERLRELVTEGKITEAQKTLIVNKQNELQANKPNRNSFKDLTPVERKSQMEAKKTELDSWAKENGIDPQYLMGGFGPGGRGHAPKM